LDVEFPCRFAIKFLWFPLALKNTGFDFETREVPIFEPLSEFHLRNSCIIKSSIVIRTRMYVSSVFSRTTRFSRDSRACATALPCDLDQVMKTNIYEPLLFNESLRFQNCARVALDRHRPVLETMPPL